MSEKIKAIVIRTNDKKEKDKNILLFSLEKGKVWATLKGVKSQNAKMKWAQQLFCFGDFVLEKGKTGNIVTGFDIIETFHEISEDIDKYYEAFALLEILNSCDFSSLEEGQQVFILTIKALKTLCFKQVRKLYVLNKFLIEFFKISGVPIYVDRCSCCKTKNMDKIYIDYSSGQLVCTACKTFESYELPKTVFMALKILNSTPLDRLNTLKLAENSALALLNILTKNYEARFDRYLKFVGILS